MSTCTLLLQHSYSSLKAKKYLRQAVMLALNSESPVLKEDVIEMMSKNCEVKFANMTNIRMLTFDGKLKAMWPCK